MKNSKVLSLLTAAALVVSSFSGLAMSGSVARAAEPTVFSTAGDAYVASTGNVGAALFWGDEVYLDSASGDGTIRFAVGEFDEFKIEKTANGSENAYVPIAAGETSTIDGFEADGAANSVVIKGKAPSWTSGYLFVRDTDGDYEGKIIKFTSTDKDILEDTAGNVFTDFNTPANPGVDNVVTAGGHVQISVTAASGLESPDLTWAVSGSYAKYFSIVADPTARTAQLYADEDTPDGATVRIVLSYKVDNVTTTIGSWGPFVCDAVDYVNFDTFKVTNAADKAELDNSTIELRLGGASNFTIVPSVAATFHGTDAKGDLKETFAPTYPIAGVSQVAYDYILTNDTKNMLTVTPNTAATHATATIALNANATAANVGNGVSITLKVSAVGAGGYKPNTNGTAATTVNHGANDPVWYAGEKTITVKILPAIKYSVRINQPEVTLQEGVQESAQIRAGLTIDGTDGSEIDEDKLWYEWSVVGPAVEIIETKKGSNTVKVVSADSFRTSTGDKPTYVCVSIYKTDDKGQKTGNPLASSDYVGVGEVEYYTRCAVTVNGGEKLLVKVEPKDGYTTELVTSGVKEEGVATYMITRENGADVTNLKNEKDEVVMDSWVVTYAQYQDYILDRINLNETAAWNAHIAGAANESTVGITVNQGKYRVDRVSGAEPGSYVIVAYDTLTGRKGFSEPFIIRSKKGVKATGLELESEEVKFNNINTAVNVLAFVQERVVRDHNYVPDESAEIPYVTVKSSDESIVRVNAVYDPLDPDKNGVIGGVATIRVEARKAGVATITVGTVDPAYTGTKTIVVKVLSDEEKQEETPDPEKEHYAGEPVKEDGVVGYLNEDLKTVTVTDVTVADKAITIPATVDGFTVSTIDAQAFKKSSAKTVYIKGSVEIIGKGAFKKSKVKKVYVYEPAALKTVGKNAFAKTNAKVVGVGGSFSDDVVKQLTKAGASKVKNNGTAK